MNREPEYFLAVVDQLLQQVETLHREAGLELTPDRLDRARGKIVKLLTDHYFPNAHQLAQANPDSNGDLHVELLNVH